MEHTLTSESDVVIVEPKAIDFTLSKNGQMTLTTNTFTLLTNCLGLVFLAG